MIIRTLTVPTEWKYLFESIVARQSKELDLDNQFKLPIKIYAFLNQEHLSVYKALSSIDPEMELLKINRLGLEEDMLVMNLVPFSERFFVPDVLNLNFFIPQVIVEKLKDLRQLPPREDFYRTSLELQQTSKPII